MEITETVKVCMAKAVDKATADGFNVNDGLKAIGITNQRETTVQCHCVDGCSHKLHFQVFIFVCHPFSVIVLMLSGVLSCFNYAGDWKMSYQVAEPILWRHVGCQLVPISVL
jgi:hypothetical protein